MYAIVEISGKQYKVQEGDIVFVDRLEELEEGKTTTFDKVLLVSDGDKVTVGTDTVKGAKVKATVVGHGKILLEIWIDMDMDLFVRQRRRLQNCQRR